jgi:predicted HTH domain antitoxin
MTAMVQIEIPQHLVQATRLSIPELRRELAITLFQQGRLSFGKAREMADMDFWAFQQLLAAEVSHPIMIFPNMKLTCKRLRS